MVSVSRVEVAKDLKTAKVYLSLYGDKSKIDDTFAAVARAGGFIRKELSLAFRDIRQVPELRFIKDDSLDYSAKSSPLSRRSKRMTPIDAIKKANDILIVCHIRPDGDCLGSGLH